MSTNVYQMVTDRILKQLEQGVIPWEKPWSGVRCGAYNIISKKPYSLLNQMLLQKQTAYATLKQWNELGGRIKKGSKSEFVVFWKMLQVEEENKDGEKVSKTIPMLRYYNVFSIDQVEPLPSEKLNDGIEPIEEAEKILNDYITREGIKLVHEKSNKAYYSPSQDLIHLPLLEQFKNIAEYYSTAFHEATHSTMLPSRCDRMEENKLAAFGSNDYSKEELVAEIGSANIMNYLGIETTNSFRNNVAYIRSWIKVLNSDNRFIVLASSRAEKATKWILNISE